MSMRWRDSRFEKPDKSHGQLLCWSMTDSSREAVYLCDPGDIPVVASWMPLNELPRRTIPGRLPDGWRPVDRQVDMRATFSGVKAWDSGTERWLNCDNAKGWYPDIYYIVPIDQPAPQYRSFASAAEFLPHASRMWRYKDNGDIRPPTSFSDTTHNVENWYYSLSHKEFVDAVDGRLVESPFGVKIE